MNILKLDTIPMFGLYATAPDIDYFNIAFALANNFLEEVDLPP